ncbi:acyl-CoA synthetase [Saccharomonospora viridis]|jgi:fatty-acyl-CoA synthase|uniref:Acyl-CoA synthetase (AMP-forming)/AMP-acid ligase II n=2 Tax=Saccharomonospora viridis TaxID=1852 RepID=C7MXB5_SACVD|nr:acyl-CoA synthetase [Saccharomonospora viridis]ACU95924.1 acyl-CoA synthetase (AMP-forming)/AMP-acid ligase II [Saccharomonospora viridis DSM 43017]KHF45581.1 acyl-CoA synthetase [Saccharomonospora viridis]SFP73569.1 fatty-acyl-CoA synthase [Saccharomonospora viridis]
MTAVRSSTVADIVRRSAARHPHRIAVRFGDREWTYGDLDAAVTRTAAHLLSLGLRHGDRVAAYGKNSDAYLLGFLACARAGLVHVPVNYNLVGDELAYLLEQSGSRVALADPALVGNIDHAGVELERVVPLRDVDGSLLDIARAGREGDVSELDVEVSDTDLAQLLYTSGTTSRPKGAMMTHRALVHEYLSCIVDLDLSADDAPLHVMPLYHSAQMHVFLLPWLAVGATNTVMETPDPTEILHRLAADRHGAFFAAPTLWVALANHADFGRVDLSALRKAYYGASIMPVPVLNRLREALPQLGFYNCFGQSEIAPLATVLRPEEHDERPDSAGKPALFVELRVVDPDGNDVAPGEQGEVVYRSPQLATGYWNKPEETAEAFRDGWFHSGDLVRIDDEGYIYVVDRIKDVINTGGVLVASREVEEALYTHPAVAEVAVVGLPDDKWIEAVTAVVVPKGSEDDVSADELIAHARKSLSSFKVPKAVHFVDDLPRNASGKILKRELRQRLAGEPVFETG